MCCEKVMTPMEALEALLDLRDYKTIHGKDVYYHRMRDKTWQHARDALDAALASQKAPTKLKQPTIEVSFYRPGGARIARLTSSVGNLLYMPNPGEYPQEPWSMIVEVTS